MIKILCSLLLLTGYLPVNIDVTNVTSLTIPISSNTYTYFEEIDPYIDDLYYIDENVQVIGSDKLLELSKSSDQVKQSVIKALIIVLENNSLLEDKQTSRYQTWCRAAYLLGNLKATQATPQLRKALLENKRSFVRIASAKALGAIHTEETKQILITALLSEKNKAVIDIIKVELSRWNTLS